MSLAQRGDIERVPPFTKEHSQTHTTSQHTTAAFIAVRCLSDRAHAVSSDGIIHSYRITRNSGVTISNYIDNTKDHSFSYAIEKESRIAARAAKDFLPLSIHVVSPSTNNPNNERLSIPVCWKVKSCINNESGSGEEVEERREEEEETSFRSKGVYRQPICWSSAGSVLACSNGTTGSIILWGIDKDGGIGKGDKYCSVAINSEASANGGHFTGIICFCFFFFYFIYMLIISTTVFKFLLSFYEKKDVTSLCISGDTLLSGSSDGMILLWFLCRVPRSKRPAVSSKPFYILRGHTNAVSLSSMSHAVGIAVTSSSASGKT